MSALRLSVLEIGSRELQYMYRFLRKECCSSLAKTCQLLSSPQAVPKSPEAASSSSRHREAFVYGPSERSSIPVWNLGDPTKLGDRVRIPSRSNQLDPRSARTSSPSAKRPKKSIQTTGQQTSSDEPEASPNPTTTSHLVERFRNLRQNGTREVQETSTDWKSGSPHLAHLQSDMGSPKSNQASLTSDVHLSTAATRSNASHNDSAKSSAATSEQSSLPLPSLSAPTTQSQLSSISLSILPDSTIPTSTDMSTQSGEQSMTSSLAGSASPPIF